METGSKLLDLSPRSMVSSRPLVTSSPSQSCAPTMMSGPSPAGPATLSWSRLSPKATSCSDTSILYLSVKLLVSGVRALTRLVSAQIVSVPSLEAAGLGLVGLTIAAAGVSVAAAAAGVSVAAGAAGVSVGAGAAAGVSVGAGGGV